MRVLVVNAGSSSLKLALATDGAVSQRRTVDDWDGEDLSPLDDLLGAVSEVDAVGHRVVHGGRDLVAPTPIDDEVVVSLEALASLAPLHQHRSLAGIAAARTLLPRHPHVACFDTAFHASIPDAGSTYALPASWRARWPLRRFGFHGLSHAHATRRATELAGRTTTGTRLVSCHLGAGASLCAVVDGRSVDTTMGFTPLEGLVMQTRSGDVDPGLVLWLLEEAGLSPAEVRTGLERDGGLAGLAGDSGDLRQVRARRSAGDPEATLAIAVYLHRLVRGIGAMAASAGGMDLLVFTGGVGQHDPEVRAAAGEALGWCGVAIDPDRNAATSDEGIEADREITGAAATVRSFVTAAEEEAEIARLTAELLAG